MSSGVKTSGNRPGYKIFSFNTSVRNPKRNDEFLRAFLRYEGKLFDSVASRSYLCELVRCGVYQFVNVPEYIRQKWSLNIELTSSEVNDLIDANPQATGLHNRVMTSYMRSLKDQGFLIYEDDPNGSRYHIIRLSKLGKDLIDENKDTSIVYTKVMLGLHAKNPSRQAMYNESRPFLNALFVINKVNELWKSMGNQPKGVLRHEFSTFILSMKDNNYEKAAKEIIKYRTKFRSEVNMTYINDYLEKNDILPLAQNSICNDYPDDVFRKFEMTGLFISHGHSKYIYYNLSDYNKEKIDLIIKYYDGYGYNDFNTPLEYYEFLASMEIPWEENLEMRRRIAKTKAAYLGRPFNDSIPLEQEELQLDRAFYSHALARAISKYDIKLILNELMILSGINKTESKFKDIAESLRLEYLLALAIGKLYGTDGLVSNIIYNENGDPMHWALGNQCDIMVFRSEGSLILEPTMLCSRDQQKRNETTSITRHAIDASGQYQTNFKVLMIAPKVHQDTIDYFTYRSARNNLEMITLTIARIVGLFAENQKYNDLLKDLDNIFNFFMENDNNLDLCADFINSYRPEQSIYQN